MVMFRPLLLVIVNPCTLVIQRTLREGKTIFSQQSYFVVFSSRCYLIVVTHRRAWSKVISICASKVPGPIHDSFSLKPWWSFDGMLDRAVTVFEV
jgi:hypothetical protein